MPMLQVHLKGIKLFPAALPYSHHQPPEITTDNNCPTSLPPTLWIQTKKSSKHMAWIQRETEGSLNFSPTSLSASPSGPHSQQLSKLSHVIS